MTHCWFTEVTHDSVQHLEANIQDDAAKDKRWTQEKQVSAVIAYGNCASVCVSVRKWLKYMRICFQWVLKTIRNLNRLQMKA